MTKHIAPALLGAGFALSASAAFAADTQYSVTVGAATDYVFRGVSQTNGDPFVFAALNVGSGAFYAGTGAENVDFGNSIDAEYDVYAGWKPTLGGFALDLGFVRYGYMNQPDGVDIDTVELKTALSRAVGAGSVGAAVLHTSDYFGSDERGTYYELNGGYALGEQWSLSAAAGQQDVGGDGADFATWNLGVGYTPIRHVTVDLRYHDTDVHELGDNFDSRVVGTLKATF